MCPRPSASHKKGTKKGNEEETKRSPQSDKTTENNNQNLIDAVFVYFLGSMKEFEWTIIISSFQQQQQQQKGRKEKIQHA